MTAIFRPRIWRCLWIVLFTAICLAPSAAEARRRRVRKKPAPVKVNNVKIDPSNVFDPSVKGEDRWPFTWANKIHAKTRPHVVERELLFKPGSLTSLDLVEESERKLRALPFIKDAEIRMVPGGAGKVNADVRTQDSWTLQPQLNFGSEGGEDTFSAGILEKNLFGYGKTVSYFYRDEADGIKREYGYEDPQLLGTRGQLSSSYIDSSLGNEQHLDLSRPFYSLRARAAGGIAWGHVNSDQRVVEGGTEINRYHLDQHRIHTFYGRTLNRDPDWVHRGYMRYRFSDDFFRPTETTVPGTLPENKTLSGPIAEWTLQEADYIKERFVETAGRVEDINLGHQANISVGYYGKFMGSTSNTIPFALSEGVGWGGQQDTFGLASLGMTGRYNLYQGDANDGQLSNTIYFANFNLYRHIPAGFPWLVVGHLEGAYIQNPDLENFLELGGDSGLRGFNNQAFLGNKSALFNLETRGYYPREILHLAYLGGAMFVDVGQVQPPGEPFSHKDIRANIGAGLRIALSRSSEATVIRLDLAYALGRIQQDDRIIFSITTGQGFKRSGNTYGNFPDLPSS